MASLGPPQHLVLSSEIGTNPPGQKTWREVALGSTFSTLTDPKGLLVCNTYSDSAEIDVVTERVEI